MPNVKKAGRPPRLSREEVLTCAMAMLESGGYKALSIRAMAKHLGTSPSNLYTYFPNKQSLLDALGEKAFENIAFILDDALVWDQQITHWMEQVHSQLLNSQDLILLMGLAGTSPKSLSIIQAIAQLLESLGIENQQAVLHAQSLFWTVMSFTLFEVQASSAEVVEQLLNQAKQSAYASTAEKMAIKNLAPLWQTQLQRNIDGLRYQVHNACNNPA